LAHRLDRLEVARLDLEVRQRLIRLALVVVRLHRLMVVRLVVIPLALPNLGVRLILALLVPRQLGALHLEAVVRSIILRVGIDETFSCY
jgi:hypothetical protein